MSLLLFLLTKLAFLCKIVRSEKSKERGVFMPKNKDRMFDNLVSKTKIYLIIIAILFIIICVYKLYLISYAIKEGNLC